MPGPVHYLTAFLLNAAGSYHFAYLQPSPALRGLQRCLPVQLAAFTVSNVYNNTGITGSGKYLFAPYVGQELFAASIVVITADIFIQGLLIFSANPDY